MSGTIICQCGYISDCQEACPVCKTMLKHPIELKEVKKEPTVKSKAKITKENE
jgi:hypothetical protein